ncbi:uncharacterized protein LOC122499678 [Leptopilina heterotoma]|uniref:uncharacterized protein LOC122499678 n=1 Tax=Leptopilina heterotoma TaxID=63436 RepID=UPI001CA9B3C1|nr:uncharacterized protein LOC122499678 [Leptopilina heterotoma]
MIEGKNFKKYAPHNVLTIENNPIMFEYSICLKLYGKESVFQVTKDENAFRENGLIGMNLLYDQKFKMDLQKGILKLGPKILYPQSSANKRDKICFTNFKGRYSAITKYDYEIIYKKGIANTNADALSRIPRVQMTTDGTNDTLEQQNWPTTGVNEKNKNMEIDTQTEDDNSIIDDENKNENMEIDSQTEESDHKIIKDEFKVIKNIKLTTDTKEVQWIRDIPQNENDDANKMRLKRNKIEETGQLIIRREFGPTRIKEIWITKEKTEEDDKIKISPQVTNQQLTEFLEKETREERLRIIYEDIDENKISRILCKIWKGGDKEIYLIKKHIERNRRKIIAEAHKGILGGHYSKDITVQKIRNMTNWPNITKDVEDFIKTCDLCQRLK